MAKKTATKAATKATAGKLRREACQSGGPAKIRQDRQGSHEEAREEAGAASQRAEAERQQHVGARLRARRRTGFRRKRRLGLHPHARIPGHEPGAPDADAGGQGPAQRRAVGKLRNHAVSLQQAWAGEILPQSASKAGDDRQRDVLPDRHALSLCGARHLSDARLPAICRRGRRKRRRLREEDGSREGGGSRDRRAASRCSTHST